MRSCVLFALLGVLFLSSCQTYSKRKHAINAHYGYRSFSDSDFDDVGDQPVYGFEGLLGLTKQGLGLEAGWFPSEEDDVVSGVDTSLEVDEFLLGLRNTWNTDDLLQPYIGAGVTYSDVSAENLSTTANDGDEVWGLYARAGLALAFGIFQVGVDVRGGASEDGLENDASLEHVQATGFVGLTF